MVVNTTVEQDVNIGGDLFLNNTTNAAAGFTGYPKLVMLQGTIGSGTYGSTVTYDFGTAKENGFIEIMGSITSSAVYYYVSYIFNYGFTVIPIFSKYYASDVMSVNVSVSNNILSVQSSHLDSGYPGTSTFLVKISAYQIEQ